MYTDELRWKQSSVKTVKKLIKLFTNDYIIITMMYVVYL